MCLMVCFVCFVVVAIGCFATIIVLGEDAKKRRDAALKKRKEKEGIEKLKEEDIKD